MKTLDRLLEDIDRNLRDGKDLQFLDTLLEQYTGNDWEAWALFDDEKYARNLLFRNDIFEVLVLCWGIGQSSRPHDHPAKGCLVKVLEGELTEKIFRRSDELKLIEEHIIVKGQIAFQKGDQILHDIINHSGKRAVSLHIYAEPLYQPMFF